MLDGLSDVRLMHADTLMQVKDGGGRIPHPLSPPPPVEQYKLSAQAAGLASVCEQG